ncbi:MAG TPA: xanthine dehydrogenase family protein subunit M [Azospirillum sp.]
MIPGSYDYHRPATLAEAVAMLSDLGEDARVLAGGHSLIPMMKLRLAQPTALVDLARLPELKGIAVEAGTLVIGAAVTQHELIVSDELARRCPILRAAALLIADPQVRYCGTVGGNVANGDPGNDLPALMQCLDATYVAVGRGGERRLRARDFYQGAYATSLEPGEILTHVRIPEPPAGHGWAYEKLKRKVGDYATAAAAVVLTRDGGAITSAAVALTNLADTPVFAEAAGDALVGTSGDEAAAANAAARARTLMNPASDGRGPADYRTSVGAVMVRRAIARALTRAA